MRFRSMIGTCALAAALGAGSAAAADSKAEPGVGFRGWGPRVGASADADQLLFGAQFLGAEIVVEPLRIPEILHVDVQALALATHTKGAAQSVIAQDLPGGGAQRGGIRTRWGRERVVFFPERQPLRIGGAP